MASIVDIVIIIIILLGAINGYRKGFFKELASLLGLITGLIVACLLYVTVADRLYHTITDSMTVAQIIAFVAIWILVPLVFTLIASLLTNTLKTFSLGWLNKLLGFALGGVMWVLLLGILIIIVDCFDTDNHLISETMKEGSVLYYPVKLCVYDFIILLLSFRDYTGNPFK